MTPPFTIGNRPETKFANPLNRLAEKAAKRIQAVSFGAGRKQVSRADREQKRRGRSPACQFDRRICQSETLHSDFRELVHGVVFAGRFQRGIASEILLVIVADV